MDSYERVMSAVNRQRPDRVPIDYVATPEFDAKLKEYLQIEDDEMLRRKLGVDFRWVAGKYVGPSDMIGSVGINATGRDFLGIVWKPVKNEFGTYNEIAYHPLAQAKSVKDIDEYPWPSVDWFDFSHLKEQIKRLNDEQRYAIVYFIGGTFETPWYMRGMERFLMDLVECPEIAEAICRRVKDFYKERALRALEAGDGQIDIVFSGGDIGTQKGMMLSPGLWREHIKPFSKELIRPFKDMGLITMYHSCGSMVPVIEDLIEIGLDILDPIQPLAAGMDAESLKKQFGDRLVFRGGIDEQKLLPYGTVDDVRRETGRVIDVLGEEGGYILCAAHAIQPDTPEENVMAMYETGRETKLD